MNVYEFNKAGYKSIPTLTQKEIDEGIDLIASYIRDTENIQYMLLNHDIHYFTLFQMLFSSSREAAEEIIKLIKEMGSIKSIELSDNKEMIEVWVNYNETGKTIMFGFFAYDRGVIRI